MRLSPVIVFAFFLVLLSACEKDSSSPVDIRGIVPVLHSVSIFPSVINTDTINVGTERKPTDILSIPIRIEATASPMAAEVVRAFIRQTDPSSQLASVELRNDGHAPDISSSDSIYTGVATMQLQRTLVGDLTAHVIAVSPLGDESVELIEPMKIVRLNRPPVLSELTAPSVVDPAIEPTFLITVRVTDPDGASDVRIVYRQTPSLKIFPLNDLQQNGDRVAGDGIYTETVSVQPPPIPGIYLFQFRAVDRSGDSSNVLFQTIEIK